MKYRVEMKHLIKKSDFVILENRLKNVMKLDEHVKKGNSYNVRSIYFDTYDNDYFYKKKNGVNSRFKIRIRIYDKSSKVIKLEIKYKKDSYIKKDTCLISKEICNKLISGAFLNIDECRNNKVLYKVYLEQHLKKLQPKIIVEYDRVAYTSFLGNTRITFDRNIKVSKNIERFFLDDIFSIPILSYNPIVLEVKYDEFIPDHIMQLMELNTLRQVSFSKYYLSRLKFKEDVL